MSTFENNRNAYNKCKQDNIFTEDQLNKTHAIVYGMSRHGWRDGCYHTEFMYLSCDKDGNGWANTRLCREALKNKGIYSGERYGTNVKIIVKKLRDLIPIIIGTEKLKGIIVPDDFWNLYAKYFVD